MPYFFGTIPMTTPRQPGPARRYWVPLLGFLTICVIVVVIILIYLISTLPAAVPNDEAAVRTHPVLNLPTAASPPTTPGPPLPQEVKFVPVEPIKGFSNCQHYGFKGVVSGRNGTRLQGVQLVAWEDKVGLLALGSTDQGGSYVIEVAAQPGPHKLWLQVFENDVPVSEAVAVETQINCQTGFQIYQVDWQETAESQITPHP
jgi:hypothetical protein